jgi:tRNA pseudouridine32 synthase/23S rRNA pseudouridine746 synthase
MSRPNAIYSPPAYSPPRVLYEDDYLLAIDKPTGLLSVPGRGANKQDCLSARVQQVFPEARVVHRLDMETSGLLLFARAEKTQRLLGQLFQSRNISKTYTAVVHGKPQTESGLIDVPLIADWPNRPMQKVDFEQGKPSQTRYQLLSYNAASDQSRLQLEPVTGRSHQLRVHLRYIGHSIVGDVLYGNPAMESQADRLMLHASSLDFLHPHTGASLTISCPASF